MAESDETTEDQIATDFSEGQSGNFEKLSCYYQSTGDASTFISDLGNSFYAESQGKHEMRVSEGLMSLEGLMETACFKQKKRSRSRTALLLS